MHDGSSTSRGIAWTALVLLVGGLLLPFAAFLVLIGFTNVSRTSAATITMAVGVGFAWLLALVLGVVGWRHPAGKITSIGAVVLGVLATAVVWQQFSEPTSELDGTWQAVRMELEDGTSHPDAASVTRLTIAGEKVRSSGMAGDIDGIITSDATQSPKAFEAGGISKSGTVRFNWTGIYKREGDTLTLCFATGTKRERPKEFKSNPAMLLILKRER
jgi:uncharacterized protein (TIGR03067 family)